jgi:hypothetical protein
MATTATTMATMATMATIAAAAIAGVAIATATVAAVATIAAVAAVTGNRDLVTAHQGNANHREKNRDAEKQCAIHPRILQLTGT